MAKKIVLMILAIILFILFFIPLYSFSSYYLSFNISGWNLYTGNMDLGVFGTQTAESIPEMAILLGIPIIIFFMWPFAKEKNKIIFASISIVLSIIDIIGWVYLRAIVHEEFMYNSFSYYLYTIDECAGIFLNIIVAAAIAVVSFLVLVERKNSGFAQPRPSFMPNPMQQMPQMQPGNRCVNCGNGLNPGASFCPACGSQQPLQQAQPMQPAQPTSGFCPNCGSQIAPGAMFCPNCGSKTM